MWLWSSQNTSAMLPLTISLFRFFHLRNLPRKCSLNRQSKLRMPRDRSKKREERCLRNGKRSKRERKELTLWQETCLKSSLIMRETMLNSKTKFQFLKRFKTSMPSIEREVWIYLVRFVVMRTRLWRISINGERFWLDLVMILRR